MAVKAGGKRLVIVESPTKANKIASFLGDGYIVESSRGHIRDLPTGAAEVPAKYKGEKWARTGVNVDNGFEPLYVVNPDKRATIRSLKDALAGADELLLATDGDREGEAIAWHLMQELKPKVPAKRMVFHEITQAAIAEAVANPRDLDEDLVDAQETRRILDRLYGYEVSPVLWKKVMPRLSAGRVQSVATRLVVDRERERIAFRSASYWDLDAILDAGSDAEPPLFPARLTRVGERRVAQGRDFDSRGSLIIKDHDQLVLLDEAQAKALAESLRSASFEVDSVESKPYSRRPYAPFRTTTMQQEAGRKLGFTAQRTMSVAQDLYEAGFITYMRTDSITLSGSAIAAARDQVRQLFGPAYLPDQPRIYTSKSQERPGGTRGDPPRRGNLPYAGPNWPDRRSVPALRTDLDAHHRLTDEGRRGPLDYGQDQRSTHRWRALHLCCLRSDDHLLWLPQGVCGSGGGERRPHRRRADPTSPPHRRSTIAA